MGAGNKLTEIQDVNVRQALERAGIATLDGVWDRIGREMGIRDLVKATGGIDRSRLIRDLASVAARKEAEKGTAWPRRHALDLLLLAVLVLGAFLVVRALPHARAVGIALRDFRPGDELSSEVLHGPADFDPPRRLKRAVAAGGYVLPEWLEPVPELASQSLRGRYRLSLELRPEQARLLPTLPALVTLAVSWPAGEGRAPGILLQRDVPALSVARSGDATYLAMALTESELSRLLPLLPGSEVYVLQRLP